MSINELEKVVREAADKKDLDSIEGAAISSEFAEATRTFARRMGRKSTAASLLSPATAMWF